MKIDVRAAEGGGEAPTIIYIFGGPDGVGYERVAQLEKLLPEIFEKIGYVSGHGGGYEWRQNAGCRCGCSPGFVLDSHFGKEVFVDA